MALAGFGTFARAHPCRLPDCWRGALRPWPVKCRSHLPDDVAEGTLPPNVRSAVKTAYKPTGFFDDRRGVMAKKGYPLSVGKVPKGALKQVGVV